MAEAWDINDNTADQDEQQDMSKSGGISADEAETEHANDETDDDPTGEATDERGLNAGSEPAS